MPRVLALLLAVALLFQMSWAVAATYCEHETTSAGSAHFGHHVHVHKSADAKKHVADKLAVDDDCSYCHAAHPAILTPASADVVAVARPAASFPQPSLHGSALARAPDRPQWRRLA